MTNFNPIHPRIVYFMTPANPAEAAERHYQNGILRENVRYCHQLKAYAYRIALTGLEEIWLPRENVPYGVDPVQALSLAATELFDTFTHLSEHRVLCVRFDHGEEGEISFYLPPFADFAKYMRP